MVHWRRLQSGGEWGLFYGVISWLLSFGFSNQLYQKEVWAIIFSKMLTGILIGLIRMPVVWWLKGLILGCLINIPLAFLKVQWPDFGWIKGFGVTMVTSMLVGVLIEMALKHRYDNPKKEMEK